MPTNTPGNPAAPSARHGIATASFLTSEIKRLIVEVVDGELAAEDVADNVPLTNLGVHSLRLVELVLRLESAFGLTFPEDVISLESFNTVENIRDVLSRLQRHEKGL